LDYCEVLGLEVWADVFGCEGGGEFGGGAGEGGAGVVVLEGEGEAVAGAVACRAEEGEGFFGVGHFWGWLGFGGEVVLVVEYGLWLVLSFEVDCDASECERVVSVWSAAAVRYEE